MNNLFHQFAAGSEDAFNVYYKRYMGSVYNALRKLCADDVLAQDLTQEVFRNLWDRRGRLRNEDHLRNYLFRMIRCVFLMHERERRKTALTESELRLVAMQSEDSMELVLVREQVLATVRDALMKLPPQQKIVMELLMLRGLDVRAVARRLQLAPQTVRNHKTQALIFLRKELYGRDLSFVVLMITLLHFLFTM